MCTYHTVLCYEALPLAVKEGSYGLMVMRTVKCYVGVAWAAVCGMGRVYLTKCQRQERGMTALGHVEVNYKEAIPFPPFPTYKWFLAVYVMDVWSRKSTLLA